MRALVAVVGVGTLVVTAGCVLPRGVIDPAAGPDATARRDDGGAIDSASPPIDGAPIDASSGDAFSIDAALPVDAWSDAGPPTCVPTPEACNLYDDDCDGSTDEDTCGCDHREIGGHVYQLCPSVTGFDAWGRCTTLAASDPGGPIGPGYDLVVIDDSTEGDALKGWLMFEWVFIGLNDFVDDGTWVWADGSPYALDLFGTGEPNGHANENCVVTSNGSWIDFGCGANERFLCEASPRVWPLPAGAPETCDGRDEDLDGAIDEMACAGEPTFVFEHHVYRRQSTGVTWSAAQADCATGGYALAVIDSLTESQMFGHQLPGGGWTGLNDQADEDHFVYESAPSVPISSGNHAQAGHYVHWSAGEPNDGGGAHDEDCVWLDGGGSWYDFDCERSNGYLCERPIAPF